MSQYKIVLRQKSKAVGQRAGRAECRRACGQARRGARAAGGSSRLGPARGRVGWAAGARAPALGARAGLGLCTRPIFDPFFDSVFFLSH